MSRCTGHCCKRFDLPYSPEELRVRVEWTLGDQQAPPPGDRPPDPEVVQVAAMVEHLAVEHDGVKGFLHYYTCKNLLPDNNCGIYETRPGMCRDYPYGRVCRYAGCTYEPPPVPEFDLDGYGKQLIDHGAMLIELDNLKTQLELIASEEA